MKQLTSALLTLLVAVSVVSCQKEYSLENAQFDGVLKMKIDGKQWMAQQSATAAFASGSLTITGLSNDNIGLLILLAGDSIATYTLDRQSANYATVTDVTGVLATDEGTNINEAGGEVTLSKIDTVNKTITGAFVFKVYRGTDAKQFVITEGRFINLKYTGTPTIGGGSTDPGPDPDPDPSGESFQAKANGTNFSPTSINISIVGDKLLINSIEGPDPVTSKVILLSIPDAIAAGTYQFEDGTDGIYATYYEPATIYASKTGILTITEHDTANKTIKGTFAFEAEDLSGGLTTKSITQGSFTVTYP